MKDEPVLCAECDSKMVLRKSTLNPNPFYGCSRFPACGGTHGAHPDGKPLGKPANKETKAWRIKAHAAFDVLWKRKLAIRRKQRGAEYKQQWARNSGYKWLCAQLSITRKECHIGEFDIDMCKRVVYVCENWKNLREKQHEESTATMEKQGVGNAAASIDV